MILGTEAEIVVAKVYLDNSDFSRLYNAEAHNLEALRDEIVAAADDGRATFWYSYWHIFEFLQPAEAKFIEDRRRRARFLKRLCGTNTLPYFSDVMADKTVPMGLWMPITVFERASLGMQERVDKAVEDRGPLNRAYRRKAKSPALRKKLFQKLFPSNSYEISVKAEHGLTEEFVEAAPISRCIRGEISDKQMKKYSSQMFCDPEYFFQKWFVELGHANPLQEILLETGSRWIAAINEAIAKYESYREQRVIAVKAKRDLHDKLREIDLPESLKKVVSDNIRYKINIPPQVSIGDALSSDIFSEERLKFIECYVKYHLNSNTGKENDISDLMHVFYTPDVDIMRCDKAIYEALRKCPHLQTSKLVRKLEDIPSAIDRFLRPASERDINS